MTPLRPYENEAPAPISRRFFAFFIDIIILVVLHGFLFSLSGFLFSLTPSYQADYQVLNEARNQCFHLQEEAKVSSFPKEGEERFSHPLSQEEYFLQWLRSQIVLAYGEDPSSFEMKGIKSIPYQEAPADYEKDHLSYFYVAFCKSKNEEYGLFELKEETYEQHYYFVLQSKSYNYANELLWEYDFVDYSYPRLKSKFAAEVQYYLAIDSKYQTGLSLYNLLAKSYQEIWNEEVEILLSSDAYSKANGVYLDKYRSLSFVIDGACLLAYAVSFLAYLLPQVFFTSHQSFGKKWIKVLSVDVDGYRLSLWQIIVRNIMKFFAFFGFTIIGDFLVSGANSAWMFPLFSLGAIPISVLSVDIVCIIFCFLSFLLALFGKKKQGLSDWASHSYLIDLRYYVPLEQREQTIPSPKEEDIVEVVDSSTIRRG